MGLSASVIATALGAMAAYALVRFEFRVQLASGLIFFAVALAGYLLGINYWGLGRTQALMYAFVAALVLSIASDRIRMPGPILGNDDIVFWFVSQRMFPPIVTAFALFLMYTEIGRMGFRLIDSYVGLTLAYVAFSLPIVIWLMRDFFAALPIEVEEAAMSTMCRPGGSSSALCCRCPSRGSSPLFSLRWPSCGTSSCSRSS